MKLGITELLLIGAIVLILFGPAVGAWVRRARKHYTHEAARSRQRYEQQLAAARRYRDAELLRIQIIVLGVVGAAVLMWVLYLFFGGVAYMPQKYTTEKSAGLEEGYAANSALDNVEALSLGSYKSPVCVRWHDDWLYAAVEGGKLVRIREDGTGLTEVASTGGQITGFDFAADGSIVLCVAGYDPGGGAVLRARFDGWAVTLEPLTTKTAGGARIICPTAIAVGADGSVWFTEGGAPFAQGDTLQAALRTALLVHGTDGAVYCYNDETGATEQVLSGLSFAGGLALSADGKNVYVSDTAACRLYSVAADARGVEAGYKGSTTLLADLPGYPMGLSNGEDGELWVSVAAQRFGWLDATAGLPRLRRAVMHLPQLTQRRMLAFTGKSMVLALDGEGRVTDNLQTTAAAGYDAVCGVWERGNRLYLASISGESLLGYSRF